MESLSPNDSISENDIIQLTARYSNLEIQVNKDTISPDEAKRFRSAISDSILQYVDSWKTTDTTSLLDKTILNLPIDKDEKLGVLQLVNCDRIKPIKRFKESFNEKQTAKQPFQFYFISGCPNEMPSSLAERILYEIMEKESLELDKSINFPFEESDFRRVRIENLPMSQADTDASKKKFKEYVQKRFAFANTDSFEKFIETGIPRLPYSYVNTIFKISETDFEEDEGEIAEYLQWMMDTFKTAHPNVPTFIFLFVVYIRNQHDAEKIRPRGKKIIEQLDSFCQKNSTAYFSEIVPIKDMHLEDWLFKLGVNNTNDSQRLIEALSQSLKIEDQLMSDGERHFHMKDVEPIQKKIIMTFREKK